MTDICLSFEDLVPDDLGERSFAALGCTLSARASKSQPNPVKTGVLNFEFDDPSTLGDLNLSHCTAGGMVWVFGPNGQILETVDLPLTPRDTRTTVTFMMKDVTRIEVKVAGAAKINSLSFATPFPVTPKPHQKVHFEDHTGDAPAPSGQNILAAQRYTATELAGRSSALKRPQVALNLVYDADKAPAAIETKKQYVASVPCFTPGTCIATPDGPCRIEDLRAGDKVVTRDNGIQTISWAGAKRVSGNILRHNPHIRPILIMRGALGHGLPDRNMLVSPNHRMLVSNDRTNLYFREKEVFVAAKHLINHARGIRPVDAAGILYHHIMFDRHQVVLGDGAWSESFRPSDTSLKAVGNAQRLELFELFPELQGTDGRAAYASARPEIDRFQASMLFK